MTDEGDNGVKKETGEADHPEEPKQSLDSEETGSETPGADAGEGETTAGDQTEERSKKLSTWLMRLGKIMIFMLILGCMALLFGAWMLTSTLESVFRANGL